MVEKYLDDLKEKILRQLIAKGAELKIDFLRLDSSAFRRKIEATLKVILKENNISLKADESDRVLSEVVSYFLGLGPIDSLLKDPEVTEIMINGPTQVYIERQGNLELTEISFQNEERLSYFIEKIVSPLSRRITEFTPFVDARLKDGSRVNIIRSPISSRGPTVTIRKFSHRILSADDLINSETLNREVAEFLKACVVSKLNILISGATSSGKTTLLNVLGSFIPDNERVITIEDTLELKLPRVHTVPLEARPATIEGKGEITIRDLVKNSLHMRPDRIIVGEVRSGEVLDMIQAMNTGNEGSMTTLHANSTLEALDRLEVLALIGGSNVSAEVAKRQIINAADLIIHMVRFPDGCRRITEISEIVKVKEYILQDICIFQENSDGSGQLKFTGKVPTFYGKLKKKANYICKEFEQRS